MKKKLPIGLYNVFVNVLCILYYFSHFSYTDNYRYVILVTVVNWLFNVNYECMHFYYDTDIIKLSLEVHNNNKIIKIDLKNNLPDCCDFVLSLITSILIRINYIFDKKTFSLSTNLY